MTSLKRALRSVTTAGVALLFFFGASLSHAQTTPQFRSVTVNGGVTGRCSVQIVYQRIANDSGNVAFQKINRANRMEVINDRAGSTTDDIAVQDITAEMLEFYYEGMFALPYYTAEQSVRVVRGGKYAVFSTYVEMYMGGAHGINADQRTTYSLSTGNKLDMSYLMTGGWGSAVRRQLYNRCRQQLGASFEIASFYDMPDPSSYELTERGVVFIYFPYEIAPYVEGNIRVELTDAELRNLGAPIRW